MRRLLYSQQHCIQLTETRRVLCRAHTSAKAQPTLNSRRVEPWIVWIGAHLTVTKFYRVWRGTSNVTPNPTLTLSLASRDHQNYQQNLMGSFVVRVPPFDQILWKSTRVVSHFLLTNKQRENVAQTYFLGGDKYALVILAEIRRQLHHHL